MSILVNHHFLWHSQLYFLQILFTADPILELKGTFSALESVMKYPSMVFNEMITCALFGNDNSPLTYGGQFDWYLRRLADVVIHVPLKL